MSGTLTGHDLLHGENGLLKCFKLHAEMFKLHTHELGIMLAHAQLLFDKTVTAKSASADETVQIRILV